MYRSDKVILEIDKSILDALVDSFIKEHEEYLEEVKDEDDVLKFEYDREVVKRHCIESLEWFIETQLIPDLISREHGVSIKKLPDIIDNCIYDDFISQKEYKKKGQ
ncbi:MAG: hypothetical protein ACE5J3_11095 [Methanosarcinales archaeon]